MQLALLLALFSTVPDTTDSPENSSPLGSHISICALVTPMRDDGSLCLTTLQKLVEFHCQSGTAALVISGTTGESATLTADERRTLVRTCVRAASGKLKVIAGTGTSCTKETTALSLQAEAEGADACMLVVPSYNRPPQDGLYRHFSTVADALSGPAMLYNVPHRTACDLLPETVLRLSEHPRIFALKESLGGDRFAQLRRLLATQIAAGFKLYAGSDDLLLECLHQGADGIVSVTANLIPDKISSLCALYATGKKDQADKLHTQLLPLHTALFRESNPIAVKWALQHINLLPETSGIRLPLLPAAESTRRELSPLMSRLI